MTVPPGAVPKLLANRRRQLEPGADPELLVGAAQVALDGLLGHEQCLCDLTVGAPIRRLTAHPRLRCSQRPRPSELSPRSTPRPGLQLGPRPFDQPEGTAFASQLHRPPLSVSALASPARPAQFCTELGERVSQLQTRGTVFEDRDCFLEQRQALVSADCQCSCAQ